MNVVVGRTPLEPHEVEELRLSIADRVSAVSRVKKAAKKANMENTVEDADSIIVVCKRLKLLFDPSDHQKEETRRTQQELPFTGRPSQSVEDATKDAEQEAASRQRHREIVRAIGGIIGTLDDHLEDEKGWTDVALRAVIFRVFDDTSYVDGEGETTERIWDGIYRHETEDGKVVWCAVSAAGGIERFWYGIDPELVKFNPEAIAPTLTGDALLPYLREAWGLPDPAVRVKEIERAVTRLLEKRDDELNQCLALAKDETETNELGELIAGMIDAATDGGYRSEAEKGFAAGFFLHTEEDGRVVLCYAMGGAEIELYYDMPQDDDALAALDDRIPDLDEEAFLAMARELLFPAPAESADAASVDETPEQWSHRIRPTPEPDPKKQITTEMAVQTLHTILVLDAAGGAAAWHEYRQSPRTDAELLQQVTDELVVRAKGKSTISGTEMIGVTGNADLLQSVSYDLTIDPLRIVLGKGKARKPIDGDSMLVLIRALFEIERPEDEEAADPQDTESDDEPGDEDGVTISGREESDFNCLTVVPASDINFKLTLDRASPELLQRVLEHYPEGTPNQKTRRTAIERQMRKIERQTAVLA